jgi:DNA-binding FrmR family transcriptional regulator
MKIMHGYGQDKTKVLGRLHRVEGQVHAIAQMVEEDAYCIDVLTQIAAANSGLKSVALLLLDDHLNHCVRQASEQGGDVADEKLAEASAAIGRLVKS